METVSLTFLFNALWQVTLVAGVAELSSRLLRNGPARYRHVLWVMALGLAVFLPLWSAAQALSPSGSRAGYATGEKGKTEKGTTIRFPRFPISPFPRAATGRRRTADPKTGSALPLVLSRRDWPVELSPLVGFGVLGCYLLTLLFHGARLCKAWRRTNEVRRSAQARQLPAWMASTVWRCQVALGLGPVPILCSARAAGPLVIGARRSAIILPASMFEAGTAEDLTASLLHEMAHVRRHDFLMNLVYELFYLLIAFHPAGALIKRRIDQTRELACDEMAAGQIVSTSAYARSLVNLARMVSRLPLEPALIPQAREKGSRAGFTLGVFDADILEERVMRLLDKKRCTGSRLAKLALAGVLSGLALVGTGATLFSLSVRQATTTAAPGPSHPDFSGRWELDKARSSLPPVSPSDLVEVIEHRDPQLRITTTSKDWSADFWLNIQKPIALTLFALTIPQWVATTDGVERSEKYGPAELKSKTHWEGDRLITAWSLERDGKPEILGEWVRSLSADGKTQSLEVQARDPQRGGKGEAKLVFAKSDQVVGGISGPVRGGVGDGVRGGVVRAVSQSVKSDQPEGTPGITGTVFDPSGARVPNAVVNVMNDSSVVKRATVTNDVGEFAFAVVPPGRYQLEVLGPGFAAYHQRINIPGVGEILPPMNLVLLPGPMMDSVEVTAQAAPGTRPTQQNAAPHRIRVGGLVQAGKLIEQKKPEYPESARTRGVEGVVLLEAVISMEGIPLNWKVLSSPDPDLSEAAISAVREWRYQPTLLNGEPIEVVTTISVRFRLENATAPKTSD